LKVICERCGKRDATCNLDLAPKGREGKHWVVCTECRNQLIAADVPDELPWLREMLESGLTIEQVFAELDKNVESAPPETE
jgi:hypothetical protein